MLTLDRRLSQLVFASRLTQTEVAKKAGINRSHLNRVLSGHSDLSAEKLIDLLGVLGVDLGAVIDRRIDELSQRTRPSADLGEALYQLIESMDPVARKAVYRTVMSFAGSAPGKGKPQDRENDKKLVRERVGRIRMIGESANVERDSD